MLLRPQGTYRTLFPAVLIKDISLLQKMIETDDDIDTCLHAILAFVWSQPWKRTQDNQIPDPTERFIMLRSLRLG